MSMSLVRYARQFDDVFAFVAKYMRAEKNCRNYGPCSGMRELARVFYRANNATRP